jgi:hypothetical protein
VLHRPRIDTEEFAAAVERQAQQPNPDFRTRLLIRDSLTALRAVWGEERMNQWLHRSPAGAALRRVEGEPLGPVGFPSLVHRIMESTRPDSVVQFLRELYQNIKISWIVVPRGA